MHHKGCHLGCQGIIKNDVGVTGLVEQCHQVVLSKGCTVGGGYCSHVGDDTFLSDVIIGNVVADIFDKAVVAHCDIAQHCTADSSVAGESLVNLYCLVKDTKGHFSVEKDIADVLGRKIFRHVDARPVFGAASVVFEILNLV